MKIDFAAINAAALSNLPALLARWLPDGRREGHEWTAINPRRADRRPGSFRINIQSGKWADFASGDEGGDPISLHAYLSGVKQAEAARALAEMMGSFQVNERPAFTPQSGEKIPITPVPDDAPEMRFKHPKFGEPSKAWPYRDAQGRLIGYVARFDYLEAGGTGQGLPADHLVRSWRQGLRLALERLPGTAPALQSARPCHTP